jgi:glycosyltransferase involved in cell wall biosynthesis
VNERQPDKMNKKITLLAASLQGGGTEKICVILANGFAERGLAVDLLVLNMHQAKYERQLDSRVSLINLNHSHARSSAWTLAVYMLKNKPKKILVFSHQLAVLLVILRFLLFRKTKIIARNTNTLSQKYLHAKGIWHKYIVLFLIKTLYGRVDHIIAQASGMADDLVKHFGLKQAKITVINNPLTLPVEKIEQNAAPLKEKKHREILYVGRLSHRKANHFLIDAFALCLKHTPNIVLRLVGDGPSEKDLRKRVKRLGIADKVIFEGFVEDVSSFYLSADVTVLTSLCEGFPNVLVESISLGTPVVSFDCPSGPGEIIVNGLNGYLARYLDVEDLAKRIIDTLNGDWDKEQIRKSSGKFKNSFIIDKYIELISSL